MFKPCELARILLDNEISIEDVSTWICIARYESTFNSSAVGHMSGDGSLDHGLFQINDRYWCTDKDDDILACGITCKALEDDDLTDDIACARRIYRAHKRQAGNGWSAWAVYPHYCTNKEKNDQRFLKNTNCSFTSSGVVSSQLQLLSPASGQYQSTTFSSTVFSTTGLNSNQFSSTTAPSVFNSNKFTPFTNNIPRPSVFSPFSPFTSNVPNPSNSVFNSNKFRPFTSTVPPSTSVFNPNKFSPYTSSVAPITSSVYPSSPLSFNRINSFSSTVSPFTSTRSSTTSDLNNRFQSSSTESTTVRPSNSFISSFNIKNQLSSFLPFPSLFTTG
ncbi:hypothetical protein WDU94_000750 [Cyamophila willieti]